MAQYAISDEARRLIAAAATEAVAQAAESDRYDGAMRVLIAKPAGDPMRDPDLIGASGVEIRIHVNKRSPNAVVISEFSYRENRKARNEAATLGQIADDWLNADLSQMDAITAALREAAGI